MRKAADGDSLPKLDPAILLDQLIEDHLQCNAMQGILRWKAGHSVCKDSFQTASSQSAAGLISATKSSSNSEPLFSNAS